MESRTFRGPTGARFRRLPTLLGVLALLVAACGGGETADTIEPLTDTTTSETAPVEGEAALTDMFPDGTVRIGIANEVPYGYEDEDGEPTGEAPEVAKAVLMELGIENVEATVVEFGALISGLQAGQYDMIAAGMFITPERAQEVIFSDPDYCAATAFAVAEGNPMGLTDFQSVADSGAVLGVLGGAVEEGYAVDSGIPDGQISRFGDTPSLFDALTAGRIDAVALTDVTIQTQVANLPGYEATEGFIPVIDGEEQLGCGGFGFVDQEFRDIFNQKLNEFKAEDRIFSIVEEFGFSQAAVDAAKDVTVEDLAG
jgi:polar amino acid transport system substrate-binding protein